MPSMLVLITYDITHHRTRRQIARALEGYGTRVQQSVFECLLTSAQHDDLRQKLARITGDAPDEPDHTCSIRFYRLCARCRPKIDTLGGGQVTHDAPFYVV